MTIEIATTILGFVIPTIIAIYKWYRIKLVLIHIDRKLIIRNESNYRVKIKSFEIILSDGPWRSVNIPKLPWIIEEKSDISLNICPAMSASSCDVVLKFGWFIQEKYRIYK